MQRDHRQVATPLLRLTLGALLAGCAGRTAPPPPPPAPAPTAPAATASAPTASAPAAAAPRGVPPAAPAGTISAGELRGLLFAYSDDSMEGREAGEPGNFRATAWIARHLADIAGLQPGGTNGTWFVNVPLRVRRPDTTTTLAVDGTPLVRGTDYVPVAAVGSLLTFGQTFDATRGVAVVYGGRLADTAVSLSPAAIAGKLVVLDAPLGPGGRPDFQIWRHGSLARYTGAAAIAVASLDVSPPQIADYFARPQTRLADRESAPAAGLPFGLLITASTEARLLGASPASLAPGAAGRTVIGALRFLDSPTPAVARDVVAILPGSDPSLRGEYVAIGAHNDHLGFTHHPHDVDSLHAFNTAVWRLRALSPDVPPPSPEAIAAIHVNMDSVRLAHPGVRRDSVYKGADDDGSGTVSVLAMARAFATSPMKPRRSILFVWHTGEEKGLYGSEYFTDHPTVPRDSIVAQLNMDMVGRGDSADIKGGGPTYLELVGSRRLSTELGDLVETVNRDEPTPMTFDYTFDANGHPENIYCRSDHYEYARYGIPIVFFTTGLHQDYHQLSDEPQYIDYDHMALVDRLVHDIAVTVANLDHRVRVDHPIPGPKAPCRQ